MKTKLIAYGLLFILSNSAWANICASTGTKVYFGNGVLNTRHTAEHSAEALSELNLESLGQKDRISFVLAENFDETGFLSVLVAISQLDRQGFKGAWRTLLGLSVPTGKIADLVAKSMLSKIEKSTAQKMIDQYKKDLAENYKILIVSHSQGNFYASEVLDQIVYRQHNASEPTRIGMGNVRVASPAYDSYSSPSITFADDKVIQAARMTFGAPEATLPAIGSGPSPLRDPWGHEFTKAYMNTPESRAMIQKAIDDVASRIEIPNLDRSALKISLESDMGYMIYLNVRYPNGIVMTPGDDSCKDVHEGNYIPLVIFSSFESSKTENFRIILDIEGIKKIYPLTVTEKKNDSSNELIVTGKIPTIHLKKTNNGFELSIQENEAGTYR
jgi:hypothetical protein